MTLTYNRVLYTPEYPSHYGSIMARFLQRVGLSQRMHNYIINFYYYFDINHGSHILVPFMVIQGIILFIFHLTSESKCDTVPNGVLDSEMKYAKYYNLVPSTDKDNE